MARKKEGNIIPMTEDICPMAEEPTEENVFDESTIEYPVMEIFSSIQGEGSMLGIPVTFVRLANCNLRCEWCDTKSSWLDPAKGDGHGHFRWMSAKSIAEEIEKTYNRPIVVLTGGEPCMYDLYPMITELHQYEKLVCIETNGTLATPENADWVVASPKPPEYLLHGKCFFNELKYVVDDSFDLDCIPDSMKGQCGTVWLQPCDHGKDLEKTQQSIKACYEHAMNTSYLRVGLQLHKIYNVK